VILVTICLEKEEEVSQVKRSTLSDTSIIPLWLFAPFLNQSGGIMGVYPLTKGVMTGKRGG
jgi:hypothetical protein